MQHYALNCGCGLMMQSIMPMNIQVACLERYVRVFCEKGDI